MAHRFGVLSRFSHATALLVLVLALPLANADDAALFVTDANRIAIRGYDTVAYFTDGAPTKGRSEYEFLWQGARWWFASDEHRTLFAADPDRYAPRFGAYCSLAMAGGYEIPADPEAWIIVDGRLYLNGDKDGSAKFAKNPERYIGWAEAQWLKLHGQE